MDPFIQRFAWQVLIVMNSAIFLLGLAFRMHSLSALVAALVIFVIAEIYILSAHYNDLHSLPYGTPVCASCMGKDPSRRFPPKLYCSYCGRSYQSLESEQC